MIVVVIVVVAVVAIAACMYAYFRARSQAAGLSSRLERTEDALDSVERRLRETGQENEQLAKERDDALERVQRAKRDAAEVANRLSESTAAREDAEASLASIEQELAAARDELEDMRAQVADAPQAATNAEPGGDDSDTADDLPDPEARASLQTDGDAAGSPERITSLDPDLLWGMTLARVDRMWRVSVAPGTAEDSPLVSTDAVLRTALEVQVAAAREDAGALIDLEYSGDIDVESAPAAMVCVVVEELIAGVVALAEEGRLSVTVGAAIDIEVEAQDDRDRAVEIPGPLDLQVEPGHFRVPRPRSTAELAKLGRTG